MPPAPPRSFLTERGGAAGRSVRRRRHRTATDERPLTRLGSHLPQKPLGEVDFDPATTNFLPGRGLRRVQLGNRRSDEILPHINLPRQFRGRWAGCADPEGARPSRRHFHSPRYCPTSTSPGSFGGGGAGGAGPEGACSELAEALQPLPPQQPPPVFFGGGGRVVRARRGRGFRADISTHRDPAPHQPPPAVSGEVGRWCRPGGGLRRGVRSAQPPPCLNLPQSFLGGGGRVVRARRGRGGRSSILAGAPGPVRRYRLAPEGREVGRIWISLRAEGVAARPPIAVSR
jgi:hypothetical protein